MRLWIFSKWEVLSDSFWFVPSLMVTAAIVLSYGMIRLDQETTDQTWVETLAWTFSRGPEGSRAVLSTVAASMMTIASVTFSITVVALQLASTQFGPRLLRNFMRHRGNQIAIGAFIATFTYCLLILRTVNGTDEASFVPHLSVTVGLLLALASLGILIFFIHHVAESIQAENVIDEVSRDLHRAIIKLYPQRLGSNPTRELSNEERRQFEQLMVECGRRIPCPVSDYLQAVDVDAVLTIAREHNLVLHILQRPGKFCVKGVTLIQAGPESSVSNGTASAIVGCFYFGPRRTPTQDVEYAIDQLVEVAVRALSPGVNDPFTAVNCVDRLGAALCEFSNREISSPVRVDDHDVVRVVTKTSTAVGIANACFDQIRQASEGNVSLTIRLLETINYIARNSSDRRFHTALKEQANAINRGSHRTAVDEADRADIDAAYAAAMQPLGMLTSKCHP